jgi:hypothetical protein
MKFLFSVLATCLVLTGAAQQYLIRYDILNHQTSYYKIKQKDTVVVKQVDLPGSGQLLLHVENYNPFYYGAKVSAIKGVSENQQSFADVFNPFSVLAGGLGDLMGGLPLLDMPKSRGRVSRDDYDEVSFRYISSLVRYSEVYDGIQKLTDRLGSFQVARLKLEELKMNTSLHPAEIKTAAHAAMKKVLLTDSPELETVLETAITAW